MVITGATGGQGEWGHIDREEEGERKRTIDGERAENVHVADHADKERPEALMSLAALSCHVLGQVTVGLAELEEEGRKIRKEKKIKTPPDQP